MEVEGCLGAALVDLLGGVMDFKIMDGLTFDRRIRMFTPVGEGGSGR